MESDTSEQKLLTHSRLGVRSADLPTLPLARLHLQPTGGCLILIRPSYTKLK